MATEYVWFSQSINNATIPPLLNRLKEISERGNDIYLLMNSPGGSIDSTAEAYAAMTALPVTLTTHNIGFVQSMANILFLAGEPRYCTPYSFFRSHHLHWTFGSAADVPLDALRAIVEELDANIGRFAEIIVSRTSMTLDAATEMYRGQVVHRSDWALANSFVHEIRHLQLPAGAKVHLHI